MKILLLLLLFCFRLNAQELLTNTWLTKAEAQSLTCPFNLNLLKTYAECSAIDPTNCVHTPIVPCELAEFKMPNKITLKTEDYRGGLWTNAPSPLWTKTIGSSGQVLSSLGNGRFDWLTVPSTFGDISGPSSSTQYSVPTFSSTTGKALRNNPGVSIDNSSAYLLLGDGVNSTSGNGYLSMYYNTPANPQQSFISFINMASGFRIAIKPPTSLPANYDFTLPSAAPVTGQVMAANSSGPFTWINPGDVISSMGSGGSTSNNIAKWNTDGKHLEGSNTYWETPNILHHYGKLTVDADVVVSGQVYSNVHSNGAGTSFDFANGNNQYTTANCGAFTLTNVLDGGVYMIAVKGTVAATCSFTIAGMTIHYPPGHGATTVSKHTVYTFVRMGSDVYVYWTPNI